MARPSVELSGVEKCYGAFTAVAGLDLHVEPGEIFALLGPNGAGKTTTMKILMGLLRPTAGAAHIEGLDCFADRAEVKRLVGYLPDEPVFHDYLRGSELVRFVGELHGLSRAVLAERSAPLVEQLEMADALEEFAVNYSRGMKKKLALVCALLHEPRVLILDEPTSGLDPLASRRLNELIVERSRRGTTVLLSSHLLDQVERICHRMAILHGGRVAAVGTLGDLRQRASSEGSLEEIFFAVTSHGGTGEG